MILFISSCGQSFNSNTDDYLLLPYSSCANPSNTNLCQANAIIQAKCVGCHTPANYHQSWADYDTDEKWLAAPDSLVAKGDPSSSTLITKLKNEGGNMPAGAAPLTEAEVTILKNWITNIP